MKVTIESTDQITRLDGVECRVWSGVTERGVKCLVFLHRIALHDSQDSAQLDQELRETLAPGQLVAFNSVLLAAMPMDGAPRGLA